jgi:hypothetical protein
MTALVLFGLAALVLMHWLARHAHRPVRMSRTWIATQAREADDDCR